MRSTSAPAASSSPTAQAVERRPTNQLSMGMRTTEGTSALPFGATGSTPNRSVSAGRHCAAAPAHSSSAG